MKLENERSKQNLLNRLRRIEGQISGVQKMVEAERDCREILQQLIAARSAVQSATLAFVQDYASNCLLNAPEVNRQQQQELLEDLMSMIAKVQD